LRRWWGAIIVDTAFVAFSDRSAMLLQAGAGFMQIGALVSTLMMVGVVNDTGLKSSISAKRLTVYRNVLAFIFLVFRRVRYKTGGGADHESIQSFD
jgi:hypothetical protein